MAALFQCPRGVVDDVKQDLIGFWSPVFALHLTNEASFVDVQSSS